MEENSHHLPVLIDFWAPCGHCKTLIPLLTRLCTEYDGLFLLAKVNIDEVRALALQFCVRSVPTVKLFRNGQSVDEFMGTLPETQIRACIEATSFATRIALSLSLKSASHKELMLRLSPCLKRCKNLARPIPE